MSLDSTAKPWIKTADYEGPERRVYSKTPEQLEEDIEQMFRAHEAREKKWLEDMRKEFFAAFPNGDARGHCDAHEAMIKAHEAQEQFWKTVTTAAVNKGINIFFNVIQWVLVFALIGFLFNIGLGGLATKVAAFAGGAHE